MVEQFQYSILSGIVNLTKPLKVDDFYLHNFLKYNNHRRTTVSEVTNGYNRL